MSDPDALAELRHHWGEAYEISYRAGQYRAVRRDDGSMIRRDDPAGLLKEIRRDYAVRPVPRHCPPARGLS